MKILVSALEISSNLHLRELSKHMPEVEWVGIYEFDTQKGIYAPKDFSVMGFSDVLKKICFFRKVMKEMLELASEADQVLLLDASSFHIRLAKAIKESFPHKKISYYILPQVWAWKPWRIKTLKRYFDELYGILPFEIPLYEGRATYVGHPLLDEIPASKETLSDEGALVFMPGSRRGEIKRIFPTFIEVAKHLSDERRVLVVPQALADCDLAEIYGEGLELFEISFDANQALYEGKFAFICSGTATLQSALIGTPLALCYRAKKIDEWIVRALIKVPFIGLANILSSKSGEGMIHPELIQNECRSENLIRAYQEMDREEFFLASCRIRGYLKHGSSQNLAKNLLA